MSDEVKVPIRISTLEGIADAIREKEGSAEKIPVISLADRIAAMKVASGENKLTQIFNKTVTEVTAEDLDGATAIPDKAFHYCKSLTKVTLPDSVKSIGVDAFYNCEKLSEVTLGNGIEEIDNAFNYCYVLTSINMPRSLKKLNSYAFNGCYDLAYLFIEDLASWCAISRGTSKPASYMLCTPTQQAGKFYIKNASGEYGIPTSIEIPNNVQKIEMAAFHAAQNLLSVTIGSNTKTIGHYAFYYCSNLVTLNIENGVEIIEEQVFQNCKSLTSVTIPDSITSIGVAAFADCTNLEEVTIGSGLTSLSDAFGSCANLTNFTIASPIPTSLSFRESKKLTIDSLKNIINALVDYSGTTNEGKYKLTLHSTCHTLLETEGTTAPDGLTWNEYVTVKGWILA